MPAANSSVAEGQESIWTGTLHLYVAFDWGDDLNLDKARRLVPAEVLDLSRRRRTPASFAYRPPPLRYPLTSGKCVIPEIGPLPAAAVATVFDFAAVSVAFHVPFQLPAAALRQVAGWLADPTSVVQWAQLAVQPLYEQLLPALTNPVWQADLSEEYFVFQLKGQDGNSTPPQLSGPHGNWLAALLRLEGGPLSDDEVAEALRLHLAYSPEDLLISDWAAAVLFDSECDETLQTIEFANLQLLEFRNIDNRLDGSLPGAYRTIHRLAATRLPFWRGHARPLRALGELKMEANSLFERTGNVLKLVGDQYLARVYRMAATRFHLDAWEHSIQRKLEVIEGVYQVVADQAEAYRAQFLEIIVIILIALEIVLALVRH